MNASPVATYGLTHIALAVSDVNRAYDFYASVFGMVAVYRDENFLQAQTPGARDVLVFERSERPARTPGAIAHFGFRLTAPEAIDHAAELVTRSGGTVVEQGEFVAGEPYLFARDPDGHLLEIWYELPTAVDPSN
jgi:catechol 2,3-dioxygenase-like lactoylglutathione lyase family enzyme